MIGAAILSGVMVEIIVGEGVVVAETTIPTTTPNHLSVMDTMSRVIHDLDVKSAMVLTILLQLVFNVTATLLIHPHISLIKLPGLPFL